MTEAPRNKANFRVGLIQMRSGRAPQQNIDAAAKLIDEAKAAGADYVQTPEMTNIMEVRRESLFAALVPEEADASLAAFRDTARRHQLWLHVGSLAVKVSPEKAANRSFLIDPKGEVVARYDKIHMFDVDLADGETYRESRSYRPGETAVTADLPWGRLGLTVCYDLRFPALYRALAEAGSSFLAIPAAFTRQTGEAHWHVLMRARAIENTCYVLAAAQGGKHESPHSLAPAWTALRGDNAGGGTGASARGRENVMIRYTLVCERQHNFESWFANSAAYDKQVKRGLVGCPVCGSIKVEKAIMAPRLGRSGKPIDMPQAPKAPAPAAAPAEAPAPVAMMSPQEREFRGKLKELRDHLTRNAENVGRKFPEEARRMHYGEIDHRSIYGEASPQEAKDLHEEGIEFHPLPVLPDERN